MKKVLLATLIAAMLLCSFVGCNNGSKDTDDTTTPAETTPEQDVTTTPPVGDVTTDPSVGVTVPDPYGLGAFVSSASDDLYDYEVYENGAVVTAYKGSETTITLPTAIGENTVKGIAQNAFASSALVSVTIPDGYTVIGEGAFMKSASLTGVTIPASVTEIREDAFKFCSAIKSIALPANTAVLGAKVFYGCSSLETVNIPTAIDTIPDSMFFGCSSLRKVTIPANITAVGPNAFYYCTSLEEATLPAGVTTVGNSAFYNCLALKEVNLPEGLTSIGTSAYFACAAVKSVVVPSSVKTIGNGAFSGCTSVESVTLPTSVYEIKEGEKVTVEYINLGTAAFAGCTSLKSFDIPVTVKDIPAGLFNGCSALETVNFGNTPAKIGDYAFANTALKSFAVPATVTAIGNRAFRGCEGLASVEFTDAVKTLGIYAFENCVALTSINIPASVTQIPEGICSGCTALSSVTINDGTQKIATLAFYECASLKSVKLPGSINDIKKYAFACAKGEAEFQVIKPDGTTEIQVLKTDYAYDKNFELYGFTGSISYDYCYENNVKFIAIGNNGENAFEDFEYTITEIQVPGKGTDAEGNEIDITVPQKVVTFNKYVGTKLDVVIPSTINDAIAYAIDEKCFENMDVTSVVIPDGVISIGANAFNGCSALSTITVPAGVETFGSYAFAGTAITEFTIDTATVIPEGMFSGCKALAKITLKATKATMTITEIGAKAFEDTAITAITLPETVTAIGSEAFLGCMSLKTVDIPDSVMTIGDHALGFAKVDGNYTLISTMTYDVVTEKDKVDENGNPVLDDEGNPVKETITTTHNYEFSMGYFNNGASGIYVNTNNITGTALGNTGETAFKNFSFAEIKDDAGNVIGYTLSSLLTSSLTEINVPSSYKGLPVTKIGDGAFNGKKQMLKVIIPESVTVICQNAFKGCTGLTECYVMGKEVTIEGTVSPWTGLTRKLTVYRYADTTTATNIDANKPSAVQVADIGATQPEA